MVRKMRELFIQLFEECIQPIWYLLAISVLITTSFAITLLGSFIIPDSTIISIITKCLGTLAVLAVMYIALFIWTAKKIEDWIYEL
jgi:hypothetical protein